MKPPLSQSFGSCLCADQNFVRIFQENIIIKPKCKIILEPTKTNDVLSFVRINRRTPFDGFYQTGFLNDFRKKIQFFIPMVDFVHIYFLGKSGSVLIS